MFHQSWFDSAKGYYADGTQTPQVLALQIDAPPDDTTKAGVLKHLVRTHMCIIVQAVAPSSSLSSSPKASTATLFAAYSARSPCG